MLSFYSLPIVPLFSKSAKYRVLPFVFVGKTDIKIIGEFYEKVTFRWFLDT